MERYGFLAKAAEYVFISAQELSSKINGAKVSFKKYFLKDTFAPFIFDDNSCADIKTYSAAFAKKPYLSTGLPWGSRNGTKS